MNSTPQISYIYLPVEIKAREFHGKLLFALFAAEAGYNVVIGKQKEVRDKLPGLVPGIYVDKSTARSKEKWFNRFRRLGNRLVAWDEEGLVIHEAQYVKSRFSAKSFDQLEVFFDWGSTQAEAICKEYPAARQHIVLAGNPRFDLLRPEVRDFYKDGVQRLRKEHGRIILFNTNFGFYNHFRGREKGKEIFMKSSSHKGEQFIDDWIKYHKDLFEYFIAMIPWLSNSFPDHSIIVRPHPSESIERWEKAVGGYCNVKVIQQGSVLEWIAASDLMIHSNCTTGIEAFLLGVPSIAYRPIISEKYETYLPNAVSTNIYDFNALKEVVEDIIVNGNVKKYTEDGELKTTAAQYISNLDGPLSCETIIESIGQISLPHLSMKDRLIRMGQIIFDQLNRVRQGSGKFLRNHRDHVRYDEQKFPHLCREEIEECIDSYQHVLQRFDKVQARDLGGTCYMIHLEN
jgi:surface carbohydrate biosynthesis protein